MYGGFFSFIFQRIVALLLLLEEGEAVDVDEEDLHLFIAARANAIFHDKKKRERMAVRVVQSNFLFSIWQTLKTFSVTLGGPCR